MVEVFQHFGTCYRCHFGVCDIYKQGVIQEGATMWLMKRRVEKCFRHPTSPLHDYMKPISSIHQSLNISMPVRSEVSDSGI
jgi:hypothetical protein